MYCMLATTSYKPSNASPYWPKHTGASFWSDACLLSMYCCTVCWAIYKRHSSVAEFRHKGNHLSSNFNKTISGNSTINECLNHHAPREDQVMHASQVNSSIYYAAYALLFTLTVFMPAKDSLHHIMFLHQGESLMLQSVKLSPVMLRRLWQGTMMPCQHNNLWWQNMSHHTNSQRGLDHHIYPCMNSSAEDAFGTPNQNLNSSLENPCSSNHSCMHQVSAVRWSHNGWHMKQG